MSGLVVHAGFCVSAGRSIKSKQADEIDELIVEFNKEVEIV